MTNTLTGACAMKIQGTQTHSEQLLQSADEAIGVLAATINALTDKLAPVLAPDTPYPNGGDMVSPTAGVSPFTLGFNDHVNRLRSLTGRVEDLLRRLEV